MTIEGRPTLQVDWDAEYNKQCKSRLVDSVHEYLENDCPADEFVGTLIETLNESIEYHQKHIARCQQYLDSISTVK